MGPAQTKYTQKLPTLHWPAPNHMQHASWRKSTPIGVNHCPNRNVHLITQCFLVCCFILFLFLFLFVCFLGGTFSGCAAGIVSIPNLTTFQTENLKVDMPILTCIIFTFNWLNLTYEMHFVKLHPQVASCVLFRRKLAPPGDKAIMKIHKKYFLVYQLTSHFFVISPKLQRIWSWNFGSATRKIWVFMWYQKMYYFRLSPGGWECDRHKVL